MKKLLFILFILFTCVVNAQQISYTTAQLDAILINVDQKGTLLMKNQTIDGSVTTGEVCELTTTGWNEADASVEATADGILGIYLGSNTILIQGIYTTTGLSAGSLYWLSETEGVYTVTKPTVTGTIVKFVGQAISTTQLFIFQNLWIEN